MKRCFSLLSALTIAALTALAQNMQKGDYGYLYCHMSDHGEYTAYALSRDGYHYEDIIGGRAVVVGRQGVCNGDHRHVRGKES